jgi:glycolate oxidase iron-sulfur subunit
VVSALPAVSSGSGLECILCGKCLEVCPLVRSTGREELSPKAKHYLAQVLDEDPARLSGQSATRLAALCMACGRCRDACPRGLSAADVVARLRAEHPAFEQWLWKNWIKAGWLLWPTLASLARLAPRFLETGGGPGAKRLGDMVRKLRTMDDAQGLAPWLAVERFAPMAGTDGKRGPGGPNGPDAAPEPVVLFTGCMAANARTRWTDAALRLLDGLGCDVALAPDWTCCGATLGHAGVPGAQGAMRRRNVAEWRAAERVRIVVFCASCLHGLRAYADADLGWEPGEAERWRAALTPLSALLGATTFRVVGEVPERLLYHSPCHARPLDADQAWFTGLLAQLGLTDRLVAVNADRCCGMGGIVQLGAPELSARVAADCWSALLPDRAGAAAPGRAPDRAAEDRPTAPESSSATAPAAPAQLLTGCSGCVTQLKATAPAGVAVGHWLEIFL